VTLAINARVEVDGFAVEVDLAIERGETVALVGPNGAGKSTILRSVAGLVPIATGCIADAGVTWDEPSSDVFVGPRDRRVGLVFQRYELFGHMSAVDNVAFGLRAGGATKAVAHARAIASLERLGVEDIADQHPATLSGGQAQRVALARTLVLEPGVLLLDEPMAALDVTARGAVRHDLRRWLDETGASRLIVSHDPVDAHAVADRIVVLEGGRVTQRGTIADLAAAPRSAYVADLVGTNLIDGTLCGGVLQASDGTEFRVGAHSAPDGPAVAAVRPAAIALHRERPEGSPRNVWSTTVAAIDRSPDRVRVRLAAPLGLVVEVTEAGLGALRAQVGDPIWASVKASEITVVPDA